MFKCVLEYLKRLKTPKKIDVANVIKTYLGCI